MCFTSKLEVKCQADDRINLTSVNTQRELFFAYFSNIYDILLSWKIKNVDYNVMRLEGDFKPSEFSLDDDCFFTISLLQD